MKNKEFFFMQYNKINWQNQKKTKINSFVNKYIINNIITKNKGESIKIFDIGFGIGFFIQMLIEKLPPFFKNITLESCEPSYKNYHNSIIKSSHLKEIKIETFNKTFLDTETNTKFDIITAIYVFPHFESDEMNEVATKINLMLNKKGKFVLVVANEKYLEEKLKSKKDLFIEQNTIKFHEKEYKEILHYSEIPEIGTIIDYNREEKYYIDLFKRNGFEFDLKKDLDDNGFICTVFVFSKK